VPRLVVEPLRLLDAINLDRRPKLVEPLAQAFLSLGELG
jgi:hypothetical protein